MPCCSVSAAAYILNLPPAGIRPGNIRFAAGISSVRIHSDNSLPADIRPDSFLPADIRPASIPQAVCCIDPDTAPFPVSYTHLDVYKRQAVMRKRPRIDDDPFCPVVVSLLNLID